MSESKATAALKAKVDALNAQVAALNARLSVAGQVYRDQKARIVELESVLAKRGVKAVNIAAQPEVTYYVTADGTRWEKTRVGNKASARPVH